MISVIIPTYNAMGNIERLIDGLDRQAVDDTVEIIIIDSSSDDGTAGYCANRRNINFIQIEKSAFNHGKTRNDAVKSSSGDVLVFMTQDAVPYDEQFLSCLTKPIRDGTAAAAYGRQVARPDATVIERLTREFNYPDRDMVKSKASIEKMGIKAFFFTNVCSAVTRKQFESVNGFPDGAILNEDMMLAYKLIMAGEKVLYVSEARVVHSHRYTCMQQFRRNFDIGASLSMNPAILQYAKAETEGTAFVSVVLKQLYAQKAYRAVFAFLLESAFKLVGYKMGVHYRMLPVRLVKKCSMSRNYWANGNGNGYILPSGG